MELTLDEALQKGIEAHKTGQIQEADRLYTAILKAQPKHPDANHNLGLLAVGVGKVQEALPFFKAALEANPSAGQFWLSFIEALIKLGHMTEAKVVFDQAKGKGASGDAFDQIEKQLFEPSIIEAKPQDPPSVQLQSIMNLFNQGLMQSVLSEGIQMLKGYPNSFVLYNLLGAANVRLMQYNEAIGIYKKAIKLKPDSAEAHSNMGIAYKGTDDLMAAIESFKQAIKIRPDFAEAYNNMGLALKDKGDNEAAIECYKQAVKIKPDFFEAYYNQGIMLFDSNQYEKAAECLKLTNFANSKHYLLRCLYLQDNKTLFYQQLDYFINQDEVHPIIGSLGCRAELRYKIKRRNLFCKKPLNYVLTTDLSGLYDFNQIFIKAARTILNEKKVLHRTQELLTNGWQTSGNLFSLEPDLTAGIQKIIHLEIEKYKLAFKNSKEGFITSWPSEYSLFGWLVRMKSGGQLSPHMHDRGWISGSVYINVPAKTKTNSGNLVVCIEDKQLIVEGKNQEKKIDVVTGTLCLFPSSLLHYTIPFESEEERVVLAFDIVPKY